MKQFITKTDSSYNKISVCRFSPHFRRMCRYCNFCDTYVANFENHLKEVHRVSKNNQYAASLAAVCPNRFRLVKSAFQGTTRSLLREFPGLLEINSPRFNEVLQRDIVSQLYLESNMHPVQDVQLTVCGE